MTAGRNGELAAKAFLHDCIPDNYVQFATAATAGSKSLRACTGTDAAGASVTIDLGGKRIWLQAFTEDVTVLRGSHSGIVVGAGIAIDTSDNPFRSFWVDPGADVATLWHRAGGVGVLRLYYCTDL